MARLLTIVLTFVVASFLFAPTARAGGWATITYEPLPTEIRVGEAVTVTFLVKQHGNNPVHQAFDQTIIATLAIQPEGGKAVLVEATPTDKVGYFSAPVTFPSEGSYELNVTLNVLQVDAVPHAVTVAAAATSGNGAAEEASKDAAPANAPLVAGATTATAPNFSLMLLLGVGILLLLGAVAIARTR